MKINTYIGFALKSGEVVYGIDNLTSTKKDVHIVLCNENLSDKGKKELNYLSHKYNWKIINVNSQLLNDKKIKVLGITDINLATAIANINQ